MKKLLLALMLLSPFSFADWGDTYFCNTTLIWGVNSNGEQPVTNTKQKTFKFNLNEAKASLIFDEKAPFSDFSLDITFSIFAINSWCASSNCRLRQVLTLRVLPACHRCKIEQFQKIASSWVASTTLHVPLSNIKLLLKL